MKDFKYNIIDNIINRKMARLNQIVESIEIKTPNKTHAIQELMELSEEVESLSLSLMPYFNNVRIGV